MTHVHHTTSTSHYTPHRSTPNGIYIMAIREFLSSLPTPLSLTQLSVLRHRVHTLPHSLIDLVGLHSST
jgi:hypothetical protein